MKYVIAHEYDDGDLYIAGAGINLIEGLTAQCIDWAINRNEAIQFDNEEEAQATIDFITNVLDWNIGESLTIKEE